MYHDCRDLVVNINVSPITFKLNLGGTALAVGTVTFLGDSNTSLRFMRVGLLVKTGREPADIALVGKTIIPTMRSLVWTG